MQSGGGHQRRGLVKVAVEGAKDPIQAGNFHGHAKARVGGVLHDIRREVRLAKAGDQGQPGGRFEFVVDEESASPPVTPIEEAGKLRELPSVNWLLK